MMLISMMTVMMMTRVGDDIESTDGDFGVSDVRNILFVIFITAIMMVMAATATVVIMIMTMVTMFQVCRIAGGEGRGMVFG